MKKISTSQSVKLVKEIMKELIIEFIQAGFSQAEASKMAEETILSNHQLFQ